VHIASVWEIVATRNKSRVIASIRQLSIFAAHHGTLIRTLKTRDDQSSEVNNNGSSLIHVLPGRGATSFSQRSHWKAIWIFKPNTFDRSTCESPIVKARVIGKIGSFSPSR